MVPDGSPSSLHRTDYVAYFPLKTEKTVRGLIQNFVDDLNN